MHNFIMPHTLVSVRVVFCLPWTPPEFLVQWLEHLGSVCEILAESPKFLPIGVRMWQVHCRRRNSLQARMMVFLGPCQLGNDLTWVSKKVYQKLIRGGPVSSLVLHRIISDCCTWMINNEINVCSRESCKLVCFLENCASSFFKSHASFSAWIWTSHFVLCWNGKFLNLLCMQACVKLHERFCSWDALYLH